MSTVLEPELKNKEAPVYAEPPRIILYDVPWSVYVQLRAADNTRRVRMSYLNGTLELMSPEYRHDKSSHRLDLLIMSVAAELDLPCTGAGSTTFQVPGVDEKSAGKEPDACFYIAHEHLIRDKDDIDLAIDPPPDLAIEVDNTNSSARKLPIYAALGVPEVWRYDVNTGELWFGKLQPDGTYAAIERSECLPMLTSALVLEGLKLSVGISEAQWMRLLREWVRNTLL